MNWEDIDMRPVIGQTGEELAAIYLERNGFDILERNFRCKIGEIDIIAQKNKILTFVEVKTRLSIVTGHPAEAVTFRKQQKIRRIAEYYMMVNGLLKYMPVLSFDVIEIVKQANKVILFNHFEHCF